MKPIFLFLFFATSVLAQYDTLQVDWEHLDGLPGRIGAVHEYNGRWWTANGSIYFSDDEGLTWERFPHHDQYAASSIAVGDYGMAVSRERNIQQSTTPHGNFSQSRKVEWWHSSDFETLTPTVSVGTGYYYNAIGGTTSVPTVRGPIPVNDQVVFRYGSGGRLRSFDGGITWDSTLHQLLPPGAYQLLGYDSLVAYHPHILAPDTLEFTLLTNSLETQFFLEVPFGLGTIQQIDYQTDQILVLNADSIFQTTDNGQTWTVIPFTLPDSTEWKQVLRDGDNLYFTTATQVYRTDLETLTDWTVVYEALHPSNLSGSVSDQNLRLQRHKGILFVTDRYRTARKGPQDTEFQTNVRGLSDFHYPYQHDIFSAHGKLIYQISQYPLLFLISEDNGDTWEYLDHPDFQGSGLGPYQITHLCNYQGETIMARNQQYWRLDSTFNLIQITIPSDYDQSGYLAWEHLGVLWFLKPSSHQLLKTTDGINFTGCPLPPENGQFTSYQGALYYFTNNGNYVSIDTATTWTWIGDYSIPDGRLFPTNDGFFAGDTQYPPSFHYRSTNPSEYWDDAGSFGMNQSLISFNMHSRIATWGFDYLLMHGQGDLYMTANRGTNWSVLSHPFHSYHYGLHWSTYWQEASYGGAGNMFQTDSTLYVRTDRQGVFRTPLQPLLGQLLGYGENIAYLTGQHYLDQNQNCQFDAGDIPLDDTPVQIGEHTVLTDANGQFRDEVFPDSNYLVRADTLLHYSFGCGNDGTANTVLDSLETGNVDLVLQPIGSLVDLSVELVPDSPFRPGQTTMIFVRVQNVGTITASATTTNVLDSLGQLLLTAFSLGSSAAPNGGWDFDVPILAPQEVAEFWIEYFVPTTLTQGDSVHIVGTIQHPDDFFTDHNRYVHHDEVITSYDPNDKTSFAPETLLPHAAEEIPYRIRFQNTGADTAFWIVVRDTLPSTLDPSSFRMVDASHDYHLTLESDSILVWTFNNILLPPLTTDPAGSNGHVFFTIRTRGDLPHQTFIENRAGIYFDYNPVVLTNFTETRVWREQIVLEEEVLLCAGEVWNDTLLLNSTTITEEAGGWQYDSLQIWHVTVAPVYEIVDTVALCYGESYEVFGQTVTESGVYESNALSDLGCDSLHRVVVSVADSIGVETWVQDATGGGTNGAILTQNPGGSYTYEWSNGSTGVFIDDLPSGDYQLTLTDTTTDCQRIYSFTVDQISSTRDPENFLKISARVQPQPLRSGHRGTLKMESPHFITPTVEWFDTQGRRRDTLTDIPPGTSWTLALPTDVPAGIYYFRITAETSVLVVPWVVQ